MVGVVPGLSRARIAACCLGFLLFTGVSQHEAPVEKARALIEQENYAAGIRELRSLLARSPHDIAALKLLAKANVLSGDGPAAEETLNTLVKTAPADAEGWSLLGRLYQDSNQYSRAFELLQRALELRPADVLTLTSLANCLVGLGRNDEALTTFRRAATLNQRSSKPFALPHASFAVFLLRLDRLREAREQIMKAAKADDQYPMLKQAQHAMDLRVRHSNEGRRQGAEVLEAPKFKNIAAGCGIDFRLENSPTPSKRQIETMPGGVAVLDYDQDGMMDIYFANGADSPSLQKKTPRFWNRLYRNQGGGKFIDVTVQAGVAGSGYMMGAAAGDFNNDGFPDLFVVGVGRNILYRNNGNGTFTDVTQAAGLNDPHPRYGRMWSIHAGWLDYDGDGWLDLLVVNYCVWDPRNEPYCGERKPGYRSYCHPSHYAPLPNQLFRNTGNGTFTDVSDRSGIGRHLGKGMGAAFADFDSDGWTDIFVANDTEPNFLFWNRGSGTFEEVGLIKGVAVNQFGSPVSSMGADFRDFDNDGRPDLFVTALSNEAFLLFRNRTESFEDIADAARLGLASLPYSGWSNPIVDLNNDGWKDLFSANGHAIDNIELSQSRKYRQRNSVFLNRGDGTFRDVTPAVGSDLGQEAAHRGAAALDWNNDGAMDLVVTALGEGSELFENESSGLGNWLLVRLIGHCSNRDGLGAALRLQREDGLWLWNHATTSVGFASSGDPRVHFGLGKISAVRQLEIRWPSGLQQRLADVRINQIFTVRESCH